jgi:alcohol dehydrogenase class IV
LPVVAVSTASGSGSHVTQVAVVTNPVNRDKSALYNPILFPKAAILDPELMLKLPTELTATSGFDIFCHAFESLLHGGASAYTEMLGWEAIRLVNRHLPQVLHNGTDVAARSALVWADTLAGLCIANAGVTLPHGIAMAIGGMYPHVAHGEALAMIYPAFARYTRTSAVRQFATAARIFDPALANASDRDAAARCCDLLDQFLRKIGLWIGLSEKQIGRHELPILARQSMVLPDYKNNPRVTSPQEMLQLLEESYQRN